ncbi:MAG: UDP-3-O-acyl-N-acetylglucosamine deacetylase [Planctomycetota bacterium]
MDDWQFWMCATRPQRTIATAVSVEGVGYWSGRKVSVEFRPAPADCGIVFVRGDLPGAPRIPALVDYRVEMPRRTTLCRGGVAVEMVEHVMAALAGLQIDNCEVWVDQTEMPGLDGSALPFVEALASAGSVLQTADRATVHVREVVRLGDSQSWIEVRPSSSGRTVLQYELDYGAGNPIGRQSLEITLTPRLFQFSIAPCRTFLLESEAMALQARGLAKKATCQDLLVFGNRGPIGNALRFPDECVRHKLLDLVGDLALSGCDLVGRFVAYRSGHRLNAELVRAILDRGQGLGQRRRCA